MFAAFTALLVTVGVTRAADLAQRMAVLLGTAAALKVGDGLVDGVQMGPAVSAEQLATDLEYVQLAGDDGVVE